MRKLWFRRKGVSTMIGGIIILTLFLTALSVMVFISQQFDAYQTTVENMNQMDVQSFSENLAAVYPGIYGNTTVYGGSCSAGCHAYNLLLSNEADIGTEIARIYINSSVPQNSPLWPGCTNLCVLNPASSPQPGYFLASTAFVNPSEYSHQVIFYLGSSITLPTALGSNTVAIVTTRGRGFSFQWPFPPTGVAAVSYMVANTMKIAYQSTGPGGYDSSKEGTGGGYCHQEGLTEISAPSPIGTLWFVNPWMIQPFFSGANGAFPPTGVNSTILFVYVNVTNSQSAPITVVAGSLTLQMLWQSTLGANTAGIAYTLMMGGPLIGIYYPAVIGSGSFSLAGVSGSVSIPSGESVLLIFRIWTWNWGGDNPPATSGFTAPSFSGAIFSGSASITNMLETGGSGGYFGATVIVDGFYIRPSC